MGSRRKARELALQFLYQLDLHEADDPAPHEREFWQRHPVDPHTQAFAETLVRGTKQHQTKIDQLLGHFADNWELDRMAVVDRNILRIGVYELLWQPEVPARAAINEAIEIAKKFGTTESSRFINGVLDRILHEHRSPSA